MYGRWVSKYINNFQYRYVCKVIGLHGIHHRTCKINKIMVFILQEKIIVLKHRPYFLKQKKIIIVQFTVLYTQILKVTRWRLFSGSRNRKSRKRIPQSTIPYPDPDRAGNYQEHTSHKELAFLSTDSFSGNTKPNCTNLSLMPIDQILKFKSISVSGRNSCSFMKCADENGLCFV